MPWTLILLRPNLGVLQSQAARDAYEALNDVQNEVACIMLSNMSPKLQRTIENYKAYDMIQELKTMFEMKSYMDTLQCLGYAIPNELGVSLILNSLNKDYEQRLKPPTMLAIREGKIQKDKKKLEGAKGKVKGKNKLAYALKTKIPSPPKIDNLKKDSICHHCNEGLKGSRKLKHGALSLYMGNGMRASVEAIGSFDLILPSLEFDLIQSIQELHTAYWGFHRVGTTLDIFQNIILIPYLEYGVLSPLDTAY
ncbi:hypothetical protein Tco_0941106 [Tanacetum coccineum]|uniref:Uncharacterized protein n=1 Tax=Tanacetum coccineum TaxID=301880 RepID=A0ABQ5DPW9_9ASTR